MVRGEYKEIDELLYCLDTKTSGVHAQETGRIGYGRGALIVC